MYRYGSLLQMYGSLLQIWVSFAEVTDVYVMVDMGLFCRCTGLFFEYTRMYCVHRLSQQKALWGMQIQQMIYVC